MRPELPTLPGAALAWVVVAMAAGLGAAGSGCAARGVPDPRSAAAAYASAVSAGDADRLYAMMSRAARQTRTRDDVARLVRDERDELVAQARELARPDAEAEATARLRFQDGEEAALELRAGRFRVASAGALPGGARTPEEALDQLRRVVARRSYAGLMRVLSPETRAAVEQDLRTLVAGLDRPDALPVQVSGDGASVVVPGGHHVRLRKEAGMWRVDDFD